MKVINIFLASSNELKADRERFEQEIGRKNKQWRKHQVFLHLDIWEDHTARMSPTRSQDEYNQLIKEKTDVFVLLAHRKVGSYTAEEFEAAFGAFKATKKPFIFTYFKNINPAEAEPSLSAFKDMLNKQGHFYVSYRNFDDLWNQFNKELDRLLLADFAINDRPEGEGLHIANQNTRIEQQHNTVIVNKPSQEGEKKIPRQLGQIPANPSVFIGRGDSTRRIHRMLDGNEHLLLLVNGEGGIGKTTMAAKYYYEYLDQYAHLIWIVPETGIRDAIVSLALPLGLTFSERQNRDQQINEVLGYLKGLEQPILFVIDNANDIQDLRDNDRLLRQCYPIRTLLTSRIDRFPSIETFSVDHLDEKSADALFKHHFQAFGAEEQELLDHLLNAVGYNTLVIELLAKNLQAFNNALKSRYPLQQLLEDIQQRGLLAISQSATVRTDYTLTPAKPEEIIGAMYDISDLSEDEKRVLSIFALLPATNVPFVHLELFLPEMGALDQILLALSQKGWLDFDAQQKSFKTNPIISEIARAQNQDRLEEDTHALFGLLIDRLDYEPNTGHIDGEFTEVENWVSYCETVVINFKDSTRRKKYLLERLGNFYFIHGNLEQALNFFNDDLKLSKKLAEQFPQEADFKYSLGVAYEKLGNTYTALGDLEQALSFYDKDLKLSKELFEQFPNQVSFKNGLAVAYSKLGDTYTALGNLEKALSLFEEYARLGKELVEQFPNQVNFKYGLSAAYERLGDTHTTLGNLEEALSLFEERARLGKELVEQFPNQVNFKYGLSVAYERLGNIHAVLGDLEEALSLFEERARLGKELVEQFPNQINFKYGLSAAYERLGNIHAALGDLEQALSFYDKDLKLNKELFEQFPNQVNFKYGLSITYEKLGNTHAALGDLEQALSFYDKDLKLSKELFEQFPNQVSFKNGLAVAYSKIGSLCLSHMNDRKQGIDYLKQAKILFGELKDQHPKYVTFKDNYEWTIEKLKEAEG